MLAADPARLTLRAVGDVVSTMCAPCGVAVGPALSIVMAAIEAHDAWAAIEARRQILEHRAKVDAKAASEFESPLPATYVGGSE